MYFGHPVDVQEIDFASWRFCPNEVRHRAAPQPWQSCSRVTVCCAPVTSERGQLRRGIRRWRSRSRRTKVEHGADWVRYRLASKFVDTSALVAASTRRALRRDAGRGRRCLMKLQAVWARYRAI